MKQSTLLARTWRMAPAEAEAASHQLLLRGGFIRQLAAGVYSYLPLGWRVLRKIERIIREELEQAGAQELLMPALQPAELWRESGRYDVYGPELIRLQDRHGREFALGATHEEVITSLIKNEISSYRQLPVTVFQIQSKFRDERRPRFGLLRSREFVMKDAYSFDVSAEGLDRSYRAMYDAYTAIFRRVGLRVQPVEAEAGAIGGEGDTHEFIAPADIGEDVIVSCSACDYAANLETVEPPPVEGKSSSGEPEGGTPAADIRHVAAGDACRRCGQGTLHYRKGIEVAHVFKLGTVYSEPLGARFVDEQGMERPIVMGCYGIGVSRLLSAIAEQRHDERGLLWPREIAPFHVHLIRISAKDTAQVKLAEQLYDALRSRAIEVLLDDREERAGVKFNDADLLGIPVRLVVGKGAGEGMVELMDRETGVVRQLAWEAALTEISAAPSHVSPRQGDEG